MVTAHLAPELTDEEAATVARFEAAPDAFPDNGPAAFPMAEAAAALTQAVDALAALTGDTLKRACRAEGLPIAGSKRVLAHRLYAKGITADTITP